MAVYFDAIGTIHPIKETEKFKAVEYRRFDSGYAKKTLRFNFRADTGSITNMEVSALYKANEDGTPAAENKVYNREEGWIEYCDKSEYRGKGNFRITLLPDHSPYKVANVLKSYKDGKLSTYDADKYDLHSDEDYNTLSTRYSSCVKRFLFDIDYINYLERLLANYDRFFKGILMKVSGEWAFEYSAQKDTIYKKFVPNHVSYCYDEEPVQAIGLKVPFVFKGKNPIVEKDGKKILDGYTPYYVREYKMESTNGKYLEPIQIVIPENLEKSVANRFEKEDPTVTSEYKLWNLNCVYINGAEKKDIQEFDLSPDEKFDIECGFRTLEEVKAEHEKADKGADGKGRYNSNQVYGDRITEIRLLKCGEKGNPENAEYDDIQVEHPSHDMPEEVKQVINNDDDGDDIFEI